MPSRRFVTVVIASVYAACLAIALVNWRINFYGVFGDVHGQERRPLANERFAKYLFGLNYIPSNFDALLVGASRTDNLDPTLIHGYRMYNASFGGGNMFEVRQIAENALAHGHFRLMVVGVDPYMFESTGSKGSGMDPRDFGGALGSRALFLDYYTEVLRRWRGEQEKFAPAGQVNFEAAPPWPLLDADVAMKRFFAERPAEAERQITIDPSAYTDFVHLLQFARDRGVRIVYVYAPTYGPRYRALQEQFAGFYRRIAGAYQPGEQIIDFNDGSYAAISDDPKSFQDGWHLTVQAAQETSRKIDEALSGARPGTSLPSAERGG